MENLDQLKQALETTVDLAVSNECKQMQDALDKYRTLSITREELKARSEERRAKRKKGQSAASEFDVIRDINAQERILKRLSLEFSVKIKHFTDIGMYPLAITYIDYLRQATEILFGAGTKEVIGLMRSMGDIYCQQKAYEKAVAVLQKALKLSEKIGDPIACDVVSTLQSLGDVNYQQKKYTEALGFYRRAWKMCREIPGVVEDTERKIAEIRQSMGNIYCEQAQQYTPKYDAALEAYHEALAIYEKKTPGANQREIAGIQYNMGGAYFKLDQFDRALAAYQRALAVEESHEGSLQPQEVAETLHNMGSVYCKQGNYDEALKFYRRALAMEERIFSPGALIEETRKNIEYAQEKCDDTHRMRV